MLIYRKGLPVTEDNRPVSPINGQPLPRGKPFTSETAREAAQKSNAKQAAERSLKECLLTELAKVKETKDGRKVTGREAMCEAAVAMSLKNPRFWELIRDTIGEKPAENINLANTYDGEVVVSMKRND